MANICEKNDKNLRVFFLSDIENSPQTYGL